MNKYVDNIGASFVIVIIDSINQLAGYGASTIFNHHEMNIPGNDIID